MPPSNDGMHLAFGLAHSMVEMGFPFRPANASTTHAFRTRAAYAGRPSLLEDTSLLPHPTRNSVLEQGLCLICWLVRRCARRETQNMHSRPHPIAHAWMSPSYQQPELLCLMHLCSWPAEHSTSTPSGSSTIRPCSLAPLELFQLPLAGCFETGSVRKPQPCQDQLTEHCAKMALTPSRGAGLRCCGGPSRQRCCT